jgi:hypothetical protein
MRGLDPCIHRKNSFKGWIAPQLGPARVAQYNVPQIG